MMAEHDISYEEVEGVEVGVPHERFLNNPEPNTGLEAKFSLQYNIAVALLEGKIVIDTFQEERVNSQIMREARKKVRLDIRTEIPPNYAQAFHPGTINLKDGRSFTGRIVAPKGHWENPLSPEEVLAKYRDNAHLVLSSRQTERTIELIENLEDLEGIEELAKIIQGSGVPVG